VKERERALREALEPFASFGADIPSDVDGDAWLTNVPEILVDDWRRAAVLLAAQPEGEG
jgi:hypothetical protein